MNLSVISSLTAVADPEGVQGVRTGFIRTPLVAPVFKYPMKME